MTSELAPEASTPQLRIVEAVTRSIDALTSMYSPLPVGHFWGFIITILNTLKALSTVWDDRHPNEWIGTTGYTNEEVRLIIDAMVTAGKQPLPHDVCAECMMLQSQHLHRYSWSIYDLKRVTCAEHHFQRDGINIARDFVKMYDLVHRDGCYAAAMLSYTPFLPPIVHVERLTRPMGHGLDYCRRTMIPWMDGELACEIHKTSNHTYWLTFIRSSGLYGEETLAVMQMVVWTDDATCYAVNFTTLNTEFIATGARTDVPFACGYPTGMYGDCTLLTDPYLFKSLLIFIGAKLHEGYRFASRSGCLDMMTPGGKRLCDIVVLKCVHHNTSGGLTQRYSEAHTVAAAHSGTPTMCIAAMLPYAISRNVAADLSCHLVIAQGRDDECCRVARLAWVSSVVRLANTRRVVVVTPV